MGIWIVEQKHNDAWRPMDSTVRATRAQARQVRNYIYRVHYEEGLSVAPLRVRRYVRDPFMSARSWIHIEQKVAEDEMGLNRLDRDHPDFDAWREGVIKAWLVKTTAICLETGRKAETALFGISRPEDDQSYLRVVKGDQMKEVLADLGYDFE